MKFLSLIFVLSLAFLPVKAQAQEKTQDAGKDIVGAFKHYCLAAVVTRTDPAENAVNQELQEMSEERARIFTKGEGRVFAIPGMPGNAVLMVQNDQSCTIFIRRMDVAPFWASVDKTYGNKTSFRLKDEQRLSDGTKKIYEADIEGKVAVMVSARSHYQEGAVQAIMTAARLNKKEY